MYKLQRPPAPFFLQECGTIVVAMRFVVLLCALTGALFAQAWKTATALPRVDFTGLTAAQKTT
ncbi:MAG: hypothetical protein ACREMY_24755, partial [bacterium]